MTGIVAGTKYRGQFEERIRALIKEIEQNPEIIVFIDEIPRLLVPVALQYGPPTSIETCTARGTIQCIGTATLDEYRNSIEKDGALERRFRKLD